MEAAQVELAVRSAVLCARMKAHQKSHLVRLLGKGLQVDDSRNLKVNLCLLLTVAKTSRCIVELNLCQYGPQVIEQLMLINCNLKVNCGSVYPNLVWRWGGGRGWGLSC